MLAPDAGKEPPAAPSARLLYGAVACAATLVVVAAAAFYAATQKTRHERLGSAIPVAITSKACEPNLITVPAGDRTFEIANKSERPVEWEILDGVMVVAERENIAPSFKQSLKVRLSPGDYEVTCGLLSNPRGRLRVTPTEATNAAPTKATMRSFLGPLSEYKFYLGRQSGAAVRAAKDLDAAIKSGDLAKAQTLYTASRTPYKRLEPVAYRFSDLQNAIDPTADYLEKREDDPAFVGFGRIERGLFQTKNLDGLSPVADRLVVDLTTLDERLKALKMAPDVLIDSAATFATQLSRGRLPQKDYSQNEIADLQANLDGIAKIIDLLRPVLKPINPDLAQKIDATFSATESEVAKRKSNVGGDLRTATEGGQPTQLVAAFTNLADALNELPSAIGITSNGT